MERQEIVSPSELAVSAITGLIWAGIGLAVWRRDPWPMRLKTAAALFTLFFVLSIGAIKVLPSPHDTDCIEHTPQGSGRC